jgi:hypothetical protein
MNKILDINNKNIVPNTFRLIHINSRTLDITEKFNDKKGLRFDGRFKVINNSEFILFHVCNVLKYNVFNVFNNKIVLLYDNIVDYDEDKIANIRYALLDENMNGNAEKIGVFDSTNNNVVDMYYERVGKVYERHIMKDSGMILLQNYNTRNHVKTMESIRQSSKMGERASEGSKVEVNDKPNVSDAESEVSVVSDIDINNVGIRGSRESSHSHKLNNNNEVLSLSSGQRSNRSNLENNNSESSHNPRRSRSPKTRKSGRGRNSSMSSRGSRYSHNSNDDNEVLSLSSGQRSNILTSNDESVNNNSNRITDAEENNSPKPMPSFMPCTKNTVSLMGKDNNESRFDEILQFDDEPTKLFKACNIFRISLQPFKSKSDLISELKRSYRLLALKYHPDKYKGDNRNFKLIAKAWTFLKDYIDEKL